MTLPLDFCLQRIFSGTFWLTQSHFHKFFSDILLLVPLFIIRHLHFILTNNDASILAFPLLVWYSMQMIFPVMSTYLQHNSVFTSNFNTENQPELKQS